MSVPEIATQPTAAALSDATPQATAAQRWRCAWHKDGWARPFLRQYRKALLASLGLGVLTMIFAVGLMFTSGFLISDAAERPELGLFALLIPLGLVQVFGIAKPFLGYLERLTSHDWVLHITSSMRLKLYKVVEGRGMFWTSTMSAGEALGLLAEDIDHVQNLYLRVIFPLIVAWILTLGTALFFGFFSPLFGLMMLVVLGVLTLLLPLVSALRNAAHKEQAKTLTNNFYTQAMDDISGIADWRFAQRKSDFLENSLSIGKGIDSCNAALAASSRKRQAAINLIFGLASMGVLIWAASHFADAALAQAAPGTGFAGRPADWIAAFVIGFFPLLEAFMPLSDASVDATAHLDSLERLNALEQENDATVPDAINPAPLNAHICIEDLCFSYAAHESTINQPQVLKGISLDIPQGAKLAILGPSGSGKTTLLALLRGDLIPTAGSVTLGDVDTWQLRDDISKHVSIIQQNTHLFNQSLFENLTLGDDSITREAAVSALHNVGLGDLLARLDKGLDTIVDESGSCFSGGERHRIALARVLLRKAPVVLLDEPTVSLDPITERKLLNTIFEVLADRTVIMVTHHLLGIHHVEQVVFLEDGLIGIQGSPQELARNNQRFQALVAFDKGI